MVFWQDGITWLLLPPDQSLAFLLADNGFDVWIANTRGTRYSRGHVSLSPDDPVTSLPLSSYILLYLTCFVLCMIQRFECFPGLLGLDLG